MVFRFELRRQLPGAAVWALAVCGVLAMMLFWFYPLFLDSRGAVEQMLASFPPQAAAALGFAVDDIFRFDTFAGLVYLYDGLLAAIMACGLGAAVFAREKRSKCTDFLFTRPCPRSAVFAQKLLCCTVLVAGLNVPYIAVFLAGAAHYTGETRPSATLWLSMLCLFFTQLVFLAFGVFAGVFLRRVRSPAGLGMGVGMFAFLLAAVQSLTEKRAFAYVSPLYYFSPAAVAETGGYDVPCAATGAVLCLALLAAAFVRYTRADVPA